MTLLRSGSEWPKTFFKVGNFILQIFEKNGGFGADVTIILRQPHIQALRVCPAQKVWVYFSSKNFLRAAFELFASETNLKKIRSVI